jgi:hypothetical protein
MSTILIVFCFLSAITLATAFLTIFSKNPIHSALYLLIIEFSIFSYRSYHSLFRSNHDFVFIHDHAYEFK